MGRTVEELGEEMTSAELSDWAAFERVAGPILVHERVDFGLAQVAYYLASLLGRPREGSSFKFKDFLPVWLRPEEKPMGPEYLEAMLKGWASADHR